jgi:acyl-CoA thioesterase-1
MRTLLLTTIISLLFSASAEASAIRIVVFGDSLTSGYQLQPEEAFPVKLKKKLTEIGFEDIEVINMSASDEKTEKGAERIDYLLQMRPDIVVVSYGLSDALLGIDPVITYKNIAFMVGRLKQKKIYTVLMGIEAPDLGEPYGVQLPSYYRNIASHYEVPFYPNALAGISGESKYTVADGYRPNAQGVDIMVEGMYRLVDAGLRWKIWVLQQEQYLRSQQPTQ